MQIRDLINATPHAITIRAQVTEEGRDILGQDFEDITIPSSGTIARVSVQQEPTENVIISQLSGVRVFRQTTGIVTGLPRDSAGRILPCLVSLMVLETIKANWRTGISPMRKSATPPPVFAPDSGTTAIRDSGGYIVAVTQLLGI